MSILLISVYELGHQPQHLAVAAGALRTHGVPVTILDLAIDPWDEHLVAGADRVAISVPMHTAMRLAVDVVNRLRAAKPALPIALFGLYASVYPGDADVTTLTGEFAEPLIAWATAPTPQTAAITLRRTTGPQTGLARDGLAPLDRYARLELGESQRIVGHVAASSGCRHRCRHCPVPTVYDGRVNVAPLDLVLEDIDRQVEDGAEHITFGDPDFLNAPVHSRKLVAAITDRHPGTTFDATVKVEHILAHADVWDEFADAGFVYVVSAFETMSDAILDRLDKGHTATEAGQAVHLLRDAGIEIRPSWLPFTPWTEMADVVDIFRFIADHDLVDNTDAIQLSIRLLVPPGSLLLDLPDAGDWLGDYDAGRLTYRWSSPDPKVDQLQARLSLQAETLVDATPREAFAAMWATVSAMAGIRSDVLSIPHGATTGRPRMLEPWFC